MPDEKLGIGKQQIKEAIKNDEVMACGPKRLGGTASGEANNMKLLLEKIQLRARSSERCCAGKDRRHPAHRKRARTILWVVDVECLHV